MAGILKPRAVFGVKRTNIPGVLARAQAMHTGMSEHAGQFPAPTVDMPTFFDLLTGLATAQQERLSTGARGLASKRDVERDTLWIAMQALRTYVQGLADKLNFTDAKALILMAGLELGAGSSYQKPILQAKLTSEPGVVHLIANVSVLVGPAAASKKVMVNWEWSSDGGQTWPNARSTTYADTYIRGLTLMSKYTFRVSVTIGTEMGEWSQAVSVLVTEPGL